MTRLRAAVLSIVLVAAVGLTGCGGGGGSNPAPPGGNIPPPPPGGGRILTGTVVSSNGGRGVDGVVIRLTATGFGAVTSGGGKFSIDVGSANAKLSDSFEVDTSGLGASFPSSELVTYNGGQTYNPGYIDMPVDILNGVRNDFGTIMIREAGDPSQPPPAPYPVNDTVILGRVVAASTDAGIPNVQVIFGFTPAGTTMTGAKGYFALNLGRDAAVLSLFPSNHWTFSIDTSQASGFPATLQVTYDGQTGPQTSLAVPQTVLLMQSTSLGDIVVRDDGGNTGRIVATGRVVSQRTSQGLSGCFVTFGTKTRMTSTTDASGAFSVTLVSPSVLADLYDTVTKTFEVARQVPPNPGGPPGPPDMFDVIFGGQTYLNDSVPVPAGVLNGSTIQMGTIIVVD